jgi:hypothetical protein
LHAESTARWPIIGTARSDENTSIEDKTYEIKQKIILQKANTEEDTMHNTKKRKLQNWRLMPGYLTVRRKLVNGRNRQRKIE